MTSLWATVGSQLKAKDHSFQVDLWQVQGLTSVAADLLKENLAKMSRVGMWWFLQAEYVSTVESAELSAAEIECSWRKEQSRDEPTGCASFLLVLKWSLTVCSYVNVTIEFLQAELKELHKDLWKSCQINTLDFRGSVSWNKWSLKSFG